MKRTTIRFNDVQEAQLELLKKTFHVETNADAIHLAIDWVNSYLKNVTKTFFPSNYEIILQRIRKTDPTGRKVY